MICTSRAVFSEHVYVVPTSTVRLGPLQSTVESRIVIFFFLSSGCAGVLVGHPFDTVKVRLQTQDPRNPVYKGTFHCLRSIIKTDSVSGLFRGMSSPMVGVSAVNAIVFGVYGCTSRQFSDPDSLKTHFFAGVVAGNKNKSIELFEWQKSSQV